MRLLGTEPGFLLSGAGGFVIIRWSTSAGGQNQGRVAEDGEVGDPVSAWRDWDAFLRQTAQTAWLQQLSWPG